MNKIMEMKFGSHLYGTNTENSDLDLKAIYIPTAREIVLGSYRKTISTSRKKQEGERNNKDDVDLEIFSLDRFLELLMENQTVSLDIIFGMRVDDVSTDCGAFIFLEIFQNLDKLITKKVGSFTGYAKQQAARYGIKGSRMDALKRTMEYLESCDDENNKLEMYAAHLANLVDSCEQLVSLEKSPLVEVIEIAGPDKVTMMPHLHVCGRKIPFGATVKHAKKVYGRILQGYGERAHKAHLAGGIDWKALSHAVRVNGEALELLNTGKISFPRPEKDLLLDIKLGRLPYEQVAELIEKGLADLTEAHETSKLRDEPDEKWAKDLIYHVYSQVVKETK